MKNLLKTLITLAVITTVLFNTRLLYAQGTAFTYQGRLNSNSVPANGNFELMFLVFATDSGGVAIANAVIKNAVPVSNGLFIVSLDFGTNAFTGGARWLEIAVGNGLGSFVTLVPRQPLTPTPYAITAANISGTLPGSQLAGTYSNPLAFNSVANFFAGSGSGLTDLNASQLTSGTVPGARLAGTYSNPLTLNSGANYFAGDGSGLTALNAAQLSGAVPLASLTNAWRIGGNSGTSPGTHFLGTTDNEALEFKVNNHRGLRLEHAVNELYGGVNVIGGSSSNSVGSGVVGATVAGGGATNFPGWFNRALSHFSTVAGGQGNTAMSSAATVGGGSFNSASNSSATVGGGSQNVASGSKTTVSGGEQNSSSGVGSTIGGGTGNNSSGDVSTVGGGRGNTSSGHTATVPGGDNNSATGEYSFAAGRRAKANHAGGFVWADSENADFTSTADNQFSLRSSGGMRLANNTSAYFGTQTRQMLNLWGVEYGIGVQNSTVYFRTHDAAGVGNGFAWYRGGTHNDASQNPGVGGTAMMILNGGGLTVNGTFVSASDRNRKENFSPVTAQEVLAKVAALPISSWNYKEDTATRHVGPMAQDFYAAFGVGPDDKHIATVDADGVALAAIQGLNEKVEARSQKLEAENAELKTRLEKLEKLLLPKLDRGAQ